MAVAMALVVRVTSDKRIVWPGMASVGESDRSMRRASSSDTSDAVLSEPDDMRTGDVAEAWVPGPPERDRSHAELVEQFALDSVELGGDRLMRGSAAGGWGAFGGADRAGQLL